MADVDPDSGDVDGFRLYTIIHQSN